MNPVGNLTENWDERRQALVSLVRFTNGFVAARQIQPCMVLQKTTQHGSTCFFNSAKELSNVLLNLRTILRTLNLPGQNMLLSTGIDSDTGKCMLPFLFHYFFTEKVKTLRQNRTTRFSAGVPCALERTPDSTRWAAGI
jgi:hypothetical protein